MKLPAILQEPVSFTMDSYRFRLLQCKHGIYAYCVQPHYHGAHCYELNYTLDGRGTLVSSGVSYPIEPNIFYLHGAGVEHSQLPAEHHSITDYCITLEVCPLFAKHTSAKPSPGSVFYNMNFFYGKDDGRLGKILEEIHREIESPSIGRDIYLQGLFQQFVITVVRYYCKDSIDDDQYTTLDLNEYRNMIILQTMLQEHATLTLEQLAEKIQCSPRQMQRILKQDYGKSFRELKLYYNMSKASVLLTSTEQSIPEIAAVCGYSTPEQFYHAFKHYYQTTPGKYRASHKKNLPGA